MTTRAEDNPFPSILMVEQDKDALTEDSPAVGSQRLVVDETDHLLYLVDDTDTATLVGAGTGLSDPMTSRGDIIVRNASNVTARLAKGSAGTYLGSDGTDVGYAAVTDAQLSTSDITTNNASTTKHGFAPKYPNDATKYLDGTGAYTVPAGGGGSGSCVWLQRQTASSSATVDFASFISSTYTVYLFEFQDIIPATDNTNFLMRAGTGGGPTYDTGANYGYGDFRFAPAGSASNGASSGQNQIDLSGNGGIDNGANSSLSGFLKMYNPSGTAGYRRFVGELGYTDNSGTIVGNLVNAQYQTTTAITAVRFFMASGNIASGIIDVYGYTHA